MYMPYGRLGFDLYAIELQRVNGDELSRFEATLFPQAYSAVSGVLQCASPHRD
jgi:hypothetical protein